MSDTKTKHHETSEALTDERNKEGTNSNTPEGNSISESVVDLERQSTLAGPVATSVVIGTCLKTKSV